MSTAVTAPRFDLERLREATRGGSRRFWSSLEELLDQDGFRQKLAAEFPTAASMFNEPGRRQFLKLMGASLLLGGLADCSDDTRSDHALPYVNQPEDMLPGVARLYATAVLFEGLAQPVTATTYDGRPTKLDGNAEHPATLGASDAFMQAAIFGLYDPERSKLPLRNGAPSTWDTFANDLLALRARWRERQGEGLRVLTGAITSPTLIRQMQELTTQFPKMRWHCYEPIGAGLQDEAMKAAFDRAVTPHYRLDQCDVIVSLGHDLLGPGPQQVQHAGLWAKRRGEISPGQGRIRLHVAEASPSLTGTAASTRLPCDISRLPLLAQAIGAALKVNGWSAPELSDAEKRWLERAMKDIREHQGHSLLVIGRGLNPQWQALAPLVNERLGNTGTTVWYSEPLMPPTSDEQSLQALMADVASGAVDTMVMLDCNPAYATPGAMDFARRIALVPTRIHAGLYDDETARLCHWHLPLSHALESFGDARAVDGSATLVQPVIAPLYASRSIHQIAGMLLGTTDTAADTAVRITWQQTFGDDFDARWRRALHDGFVADTQAKPLMLAAKTPELPKPVEPAEGELDVVFAPDPAIWDGRFANIAWLQELPKPHSKITWDNVIAISPAVAATHKLSNGDVAALHLGGRKTQGPVWIVPGQARNTVTLYLGYGRRAGGEIATGGGYDAYAAWPDARSFVARGKITRSGEQYPIATMQQHHRMDGFDFVREVTASKPHTEPPKQATTLYPGWTGKDVPPENVADHAWGMVIDLDLCIGCNACIAACNAENNVLVVGKDQVARGREMLWLRIDHYHLGDVENPKSFFQPVPCMHCEKAPCEMGCPVHATVHSPEGINQMVYNRCIGTRTCSSYCPYKVRRFNWYDYRKFAEAEQAVKNPDVTVRSRGVMEKCTYCTQRIESARVQADKENRALERNEIVTACQQACPTKAIVFGDIRDDRSGVSQRRKSGRHYALLDELGTRPRTTYLARWNDEPDGDGT